MEKQNNENNQLTKEQQVLLLETLSDSLVLFFDVNEEYTDWTVEDYDRVGQQLLLLNHMKYRMDLNVQLQRDAMIGRTIFQEELWDRDYSYTSEDGRIIGTYLYDYNLGCIRQDVETYDPGKENITQFTIEFKLDLEDLKQHGFPNTVVYGKDSRYDGWPSLVFFTTSYLEDMYKEYTENNNK